jgi:site-specific DNA recombinase
VDSPRKKTNAIGYVRVSTEEQALEGVSLDFQHAALEAYAKIRDLTLIEVVEDGVPSAALRKGN